MTCRTPEPPSEAPVRTASAEASPPATPGPLAAAPRAQSSGEAPPAPPGLASASSLTLASASSLTLASASSLTRSGSHDVGPNPLRGHPRRASRPRVYLKNIIKYCATVRLFA